MRITDIDAVALDVPIQPMDPPAISSWRAWSGRQLIVRVHTDEGVTGLGEAFPYGAPLAICNVIEEGLTPMLLDQDPSQIEHLSDLMQRSVMNYGRRGLAMFALSAVEIALWDILGKALGVSLYELLGGGFRKRLPAYASLMHYESPREVAAACEYYVTRGFKMLKLHQTDIASVRAAREAVGTEIELTLDANCAWTWSEAVAMTLTLEPYRLLWLEEPIWPPEDYHTIARVSGTSRIPIACGENEATLYGFREIIQKRAVAILQPDVAKVGGISEFRKVVALATAAGLYISPHSFFVGPGMAATLHLAATLSEEIFVEFATAQHAEPLLERPIEVHDGWLDVPTGPGLGVELCDDVVRRFPYQSSRTQPFLLH
jgi:L-alanine-DL-glutamate epimerase-like enolase superfamily enzyme